MHWDTCVYSKDTVQIGLINTQGPHKLKKYWTITFFSNEIFSSHLRLYRFTYWYRNTNAMWNNYSLYHKFPYIEILERGYARSLTSKYHKKNLFLPFFQRDKMYYAYVIRYILTTFTSFWKNCKRAILVINEVVSQSIEQILY